MANFQVNEAQFTQRQVDWLNDLFKENLSEVATAEDLYRNQGKRIVINKLQQLVNLAKVKNGGG